MVRSGRRRAAGRNKVFIAVLLLVGAGYVNRTMLLDLIGWRRELGPATRVTDLYQGPAAHGPSALAQATPTAAGRGLLPVAPDDAIEDPMQEEPAAGAAGDPLLAEATPSNKRLPMVTLILVGSDSRRALVDGRIVGVGDEIEIGRVVEVQPLAVHVQTRSGKTQVLTLGGGEQ